MTFSATEILKGMISRYSPSRNEDEVADYLETVLNKFECHPIRFGNNLLCVPKHYNPKLPTLLLNSHIDTVKKVNGWTKSPCEPIEEDGRIYGLGSNDAGASVVSLIDLYINHSFNYHNFNTILGLSCEEEVGGENGIRKLLPEIKKAGINIDMALIGEPTSMQPAIAERGLLVLDCEAKGISGHAARNEGENAIYKAIDQITKLLNYRFPKESEVLGPIKVSVTMIEAGTQHNVIPESCKFVVDVRTTDAYSNAETLTLLKNVLNNCEVKERSTRVHASVLNQNNPLARASSEVFGEGFVSPTTSDMSLMHGIPCLKLGPGESSRSHKADEFIFIKEIEEAIPKYVKLLSTLNNILGNG